MSSHYDPPSAFALHLQYAKILARVFTKRPDLKAQFGVNGSSSVWENSLPGRLALHFCAAREMYWGAIGYSPNGKAPPVDPSVMNLHIFQILLNQEPLFDRVSPSIRREWGKFHALYAELRDHETMHDPAVRRALQNARRRATYHRAKGFSKPNGKVRPSKGRKGPTNHPRLF